MLRIIDVNTIQEITVVDSTNPRFGGGNTEVYHRYLDHNEEPSWYTVSDVENISFAPNEEELEEIYQAYTFLRGKEVD